jgi:hypothetical protein
MDRPTRSPFIATSSRIKASSALAKLDDKIIGGTSIRGGLGIDAKATDAKLFIWDPASEKVVFETVPLKGARLVTGLLVMPDKNVWGWADGTLFIFDPAKREIVKTKKLLEVDNKKGVGWRNAMMELHSSGQIYGTVDQRFIRLDPKTLNLTVLKKGRGRSLRPAGERSRRTVSIIAKVRTSGDLRLNHGLIERANPHARGDVDRLRTGGVRLRLRAGRQPARADASKRAGIPRVRRHPRH